MEELQASGGVIQRRSHDAVAAVLAPKVTGTLVATRKEPTLDGLKLLVVRGCDVHGDPTGAHVSRGCGCAVGSRIDPSLGTLLALGLMLLSVLVLLYLERPAAGGIFPPCPFLWLTGFYCPGCGSLRAIHELLHLRIAAAWSLNPLLIAAIPFVAMVLLYRLKKKIRKLIFSGWAEKICERRECVSYMI